MKTCCVLCSDLQADGLHWLLSVCGWDPMSVRPPGPDPSSHQRQRSVGQETKSKCRIQRLRYPASLQEVETNIFSQSLQVLCDLAITFLQVSSIIKKPCRRIQLQPKHNVKEVYPNPNMVCDWFSRERVKNFIFIFINIVAERLYLRYLNEYTRFCRLGSDFYCFIPLKTADRLLHYLHYHTFHNKSPR